MCCQLVVADSGEGITPDLLPVIFDPVRRGVSHTMPSNAGLGLGLALVREQWVDLGTPWGTPVTIRYDEGAEVGYRWCAQKNHKPLYSFGHGLTTRRSPTRICNSKTMTP